MTIKKYKQCDGCERKQILEPIQIGDNSAAYWIEVKANATQFDTIFTHTHHFHNEKCLVRFIEREAKVKKDLYG